MTRMAEIEVLAALSIGGHAESQRRHLPVRAQAVPERERLFLLPPAGLPGGVPEHRLAAQSEPGPVHVPQLPLVKGAMLCYVHAPLIL